MTRTTTIVAVAALVIAALVFPACQYLSRDGVEDLRQQAHTRQIDAQTQADQWAMIADRADTAEDRDAALTLADGYRAQAEAARIAADQAGRTLTEYDRVEGDPLIRTAVGFLPEPFRAPALLAVTGGLLGFRAWRLKRANETTFLALERAKHEDPVFAAKFDAVAAPLLAKYQTASAKRIVDEIQNDSRVKLKLPI